MVATHVIEIIYIKMLSYMQDLLITHLLDAMHIEGNLCKYILYHLYGEGEATDALRRASRRACQEKNVHPEVWIRNEPDGHGGFKEVFPRAPWILTKAERIEFRKRIISMRFPTGYGANLCSTFRKEKAKHIGGLKTHDKHKLLLDIIPIALQGLGCPIVYEALVDLSRLLR